MTFTFRAATRENVGLIIGLAAGTGGGKTFSAMRLARGIAGDKPFCVIDTEAGRAKHYAGDFQFDHGDLKPPFTPARYADAIHAADAAGYPAIIVDSMSLEWSGEGGVLEMQEAELERMAGNDWAKRERVKMAAWIKPKMEHKKMVQRLLQIRAHLILCFRAEEKVEMVKDAQGKTQIVKKQALTALDGWFSVTEKNLPYELTVSLLLLAAHPGIPHPIKLQEQHRALFPLDKPITEESGRLIAQWAAGGVKPETRTPVELHEQRVYDILTDPNTTITESQAADLTTFCKDNRVPVEKLCAAAGVTSIAALPLEALTRAKAWADKWIDARNSAALRSGS